MIEFYITKEELQKAIKCLEEAERRGFTHSQAIFGLKKIDNDQFSDKVNEDDSEFKGQLILKADSEDASKNWGRVSEMSMKWYSLENGHLVEN